MRGVLGHTEINRSHYIHCTNRPQTSRLINIRAWKDVQCLQGLLSQEVGHLSWHLKRGYRADPNIQVRCCCVTEQKSLFVFRQRSHLDIYFTFNTRFLILNTRLLSLLILNTEVNDSFADFTLWVITGAVSVELNTLNKRKPNPVFENQRYINVIMKSNTRLCAVNPPPSFYRCFLLCRTQPWNDQSDFYYYWGYFRSTWAWSWRESDGRSWVPHRLLHRR